LEILSFDIEANGFLDTVTKLHCLWIKNLDTGERVGYADQPGYLPIVEGLRRLMAAEMIIGHNVIKYDLPVIQKVYPWFTFDEARVFDTLVASRLIWTNLVDTDMGKIRKGETTLTPALIGWHSLEAWGHRLGIWKGEYADIKAAQIAEELGLDLKKDKTEISRLVWAEWSPDMHEYCGQDVEVTEAFFNLIVKKNADPRAIKLEMGVCFIVAQMERNGFGFDVKHAEALLAQLQVLRAELNESLQSIFQPWFIKDGAEFVPKRPNTKMGYWGETTAEGFKGYPAQKVKLNVFNPNSRDQIADRLKAVHGWKPVDLTPSGKPKVDETILEALPYPEAKELARYMMIQKRIGQLAEGDQAWLAHVKPDGNVYTTTNSGGTVTGRASHSNFNIGQVPACDAEFGPECRECFGPTSEGKRKKRKQLGCDVSGLELRMLGHFMAAHDGGAYGREVIEGDVHTLNQKAAGLPTRSQAKTFIYAFLYGAGDFKIGTIIGKGRAAGRAIKAKFFKKVPALKKLIDGVKKAANKRKYLIGLDGRKLHIRSDHAALNTLLQSAGAVVCKTWIIEFVRLLKEHGLYQTSVRLMAWVHDELQMEVDPDLIREDGSSIVGELCIQAIENAGKLLGIRVPLTGEYKIGNNWKETH